MRTRKEMQLADRVIAKKFLKEMLVWLGYSSAWHICMRGTPVRQAGLNASIAFDHQQFCAKVELTERYHRGTDLEKFKVCVHESLHIFNQPIDFVNEASSFLITHDTTRRLLNDLLYDECERQTIMLTAVMARHPEVKRLWEEAKAGVENV